MMNRLCEMTGADFPLFAFSHCRDVVVAVSRAGGFGVLGGSGFTPGSLKVELDWIADHVGGKPFGVDILIPENLPLSNGDGADRSAFPIPDRHLDFLKDLLARHGVSYVEKDLIDTSPPRVMPEVSKQLLNVAFQYPIRLIANALGTAPREMIELGRRHGVPVAALVGAKEHAVKQVAAGVDHPGRAGGRSRRPLWRGVHPGAGAGSAEGDLPDPQRSGACRGRNYDRAPDGRVHGAGSPGRLDGIGLARHAGGRNERGFP